MRKSPFICLYENAVCTHQEHILCSIASLWRTMACDTVPHTRCAIICSRCASAPVTQPTIAPQSACVKRWLHMLLIRYLMWAVSALSCAHLRTIRVCCSKSVYRLLASAHSCDLLCLWLTRAKVRHTTKGKTTALAAGARTLSCNFAVLVFKQTTGEGSHKLRKQTQTKEKEITLTTNNLFLPRGVKGANTFKGGNNNSEWHFCLYPSDAARC